MLQCIHRIKLLKWVEPCYFNSMPTITQLHYIVTVEKLRHFGKAADACHVSQPSLSAQIQKVEDEVGFPLFDRNSNAARLQVFAEISL